MELKSGLFSEAMLWWAGGLYLLALLQAVRLAAWRQVFGSRLLHVFLGSCVALLLLWSVRATVNESLSFHLLGVTALTLMCGWSLAVMGSFLALVGVSLNSGGAWEMIPINGILLGVLPITLTQVVLVLVRSLLPKNFFTYVLVNGFLTAGFVGLMSGFLAVGLLVLSGHFTVLQLEQTFIPFFPMMFMPEAFLNGWIMTVMVVYRPHWVYSFSDAQYINGK